MDLDSHGSLPTSNEASARGRELAIDRGVTKSYAKTRVVVHHHKTPL